MIVEDISIATFNKCLATKNKMHDKFIVQLQCKT